MVCTKTHLPTTKYELKVQDRGHPHLCLSCAVPQFVRVSGIRLVQSSRLRLFFFGFFLCHIARSPIQPSFHILGNPLTRNERMHRLDLVPQVQRRSLLGDYEKWAIHSCNMRWGVVFLVLCFSRSAEAWCSSAPVAGLLRHEARTK